MTIDTPLTAEPLQVMPEPAALDANGPSLAEDLRQLADEAKALAGAEFALQKSRAAFAGAESRTIAVLLLVAAVLVFFAAMALVIGTVIALGPLLGPWGAMAMVTLALIALAGWSAVAARRRLSRMMAILADDKET